MYQPKYQFQWNNGLYGNMMAKKAMENYVPSTYGVFKQSASYAFNDNSFIHATDYLESFTKNTEVLTEESFKEKGYSDSGLTYTEGITDFQAQILQQTTEREKFYARYMKNSSMLSVGGITGMLAGSVLDPINYIPFVGWAGRISKVARLASKIPMLSMTANAMAGQTAFETIKQTHLSSLGKDVNWLGAMVDVGMAGVLGFSMGGLGTLSGLAKKVKGNSNSLHDQNMAVALTASSDRTPVNNMQIDELDLNTRVSPETVVDDVPNLTREAKQQAHEANIKKNTELEPVQDIDVNLRDNAIKRFSACRGL